MALRLATVPLVAAIVVAGVWFAGGVVTDDFRLAMGLTAVFFVLAGAAAVLVGRRWPGFRAPVLGTFVVVTLVVGGYLGYGSLVDRTVNEALASGPVAAAGQFRSHAHGTSGSARVVGRRLQLVELDTDPGPDLRVYLVAGGYDGGDVGDFVDLGALKGNKGNQQYELPADVNTARHATVVIWCRAFSVAFGSASLS
jgi:Electron transfer DM13